jgi:hypothetical protein
MSTVTGIIYVNPIEPGPLSMRVPSGIETRLELTFYDQLGETLDVDVLGQLELTSRSTGGNPIWCAVPATDVVNGRARAILPANTLDDPNGYRLRLYGTVQGQGMLLATGVVDLIDAIGTTSVPLDVIDSIDLTFQRDEDVLLRIAVFADQVGDAEYDLSTTAISATIFANQGGTGIAVFQVTPIDANEVELSLPAETVNLLPDKCWWTLVASNSSGMITLAEGQVSVTGVVTPPFVTQVRSFDYQKPDALAAPAGGQIVHANYALDIIRIDTLDGAGTSATALLDSLIPGDTIQIGVTVWSVQAINKVLSYYEVTIAPAAQAAPLGTTNVTFARP